jgi:hypothetical protein
MRSKTKREELETEIAGLTKQLATAKHSRRFELLQKIASLKKELKALALPKA